jgi:hypothetical protein
MFMTSHRAVPLVFQEMAFLPPKRPAVFAAMVLFCFTSSGYCGNVAVAPIPSGEAACDHYRLFVDDQSVPVYSCRVLAMPFNQMKRSIGKFVSDLQIVP